MSTFFFRINKSTAPEEETIKKALEKLERENGVVKWQLHTEEPSLLEVETITLSSEELKHKLREEGLDADFTTAPQAR